MNPTMPYSLDHSLCSSQSSLHQATRAHIAKKSKSNEEKIHIDCSQIITWQERGRTYHVAFDDIAWLQAADNYVEIHTTQKTYLVRATLSFFEKKLQPFFARCHRSYLVNVNYICTHQILHNGNGLLYLVNQASIPFSKSHKKWISNKRAN